MKRSAHPAQASMFDDILADTDTINQHREEAKKFAHLPQDWESGLAFYRGLIQRHHALMLAQDIDAAMELRREANDLAYVLNGFEGGILAGPEAAGCRLEASTLAPFNTVPLWGQQGQFPLPQFNALVDVDGIFGIGASTCAGMGFSVSCIDRSKPFLSETGYRSFMGYSSPVPLGTQIDGFVSACIEQHIAKELKGKLKAVDSQWGKPRLPALNP